VASPRIARLSNDYQQLRLRFDGHPNITVEPVGTLPPEKYQLIFDVPTLRLDDQNRPTVSDRTFVTLTLPMGYPKEKPSAVAHEQIFHPNFGDYICIADFWSPAQSLAEIVLDIGEMLQWQKYNIQSPLNAIAANWAVSHGSELPVGHIELAIATGMPTINVRSTLRAEG
jgi:ubiquitin-protein ligase